MDTLLLNAVKVIDPAHWIWQLSESAGQVLARKRVALDTTASEYEAFIDLYGYLRWRATPYRRTADEETLVTRVGQWIGRDVFGEVGAAIVDRAANGPVVVLVRIPASAPELFARPFELAYVNGRPLSLQRVSLVYEPVTRRDRTASIPSPVGARLRMLAVFSLPVDSRAIAVRRERHELTDLIRRVSAARGAEIDLRVVQYGATRERLREALQNTEGWDIIHISGHGLPGGLLLERPDGRRDVIGRRQLVNLLGYACPRLKLVTLSACDWATPSAHASLRRLGLAPPGSADRAWQDQPIGEQSGASEGQWGTDTAPLPTLAAEVARLTRCAVLAMRYPVDDEFAVRLNSRLYQLLFGGVSLPASLQEAHTEALRDAAPALSLATPALFGSMAARLVLAVPSATYAPTVSVPPTDGTADVLAGFPPVPEQFIGHVDLIMRASAALAPQSAKTGVLLYGMAGVGKTSCALELAYTQHENFSRLCYYALPDSPADLTITLYDLLLKLERTIDDVKLAHLVRDRNILQDGLPTLTEHLDQTRTLVVIDNLEYFLTREGDWIDSRCSNLIKALLHHQGPSRTILISRQLPSALNPRILVERIYTLPPSEAMLMARGLPNLRSLLDSGDDLETGPGASLVGRVLKVVQGHPMLIKLADRQAGDPAMLAQRVTEADHRWEHSQGRLDISFRHGTSSGDATDYLHVITRWTQETARAQPVATTTAFQFLACLEERDRRPPVPTALWAEVWHRAVGHGEAPVFDEVVTPLMVLGLISAATGTDRLPFGIHPAVAQAARTACSPGFRNLIDVIAANYWQDELRAGLSREIRDESGTVLRSARHAIPYLLRLHDWVLVSTVARQILDRDKSPGTAAVLVPLLQGAAESAADGGQQLSLRHTLARALRFVEPAEPVDRLSDQLTKLLHTALNSEQFGIAAEICGDLVDFALLRGQTEHALSLVSQQADLIRRARPSSWSLAANEVRRLQIDLARGEDEEVFAAVRRILGEISMLPDQAGPAETASPWSVREGVLAAGADSAYNLKRWGESLVWGTARVRSMKRRGAPALETARARFETYYTLFQANFVQEARRLVLDCRSVFEREHDSTMLGLAFDALARIEEITGHVAEAIRLQREALRQACAAASANAAASSYEELADYLERIRTDPDVVLAHRLAGAVVRFQANSRWLSFVIRLLARDLSRLPLSLIPPSCAAELCTLLGNTGGADFQKLMEFLPKQVPDTDAAITEVLNLARSVPADDLGRIEPDFEDTRLLYGELARDLGNVELTGNIQSAAARVRLAEWKSLLLGLSRVRSGKTGPDLIIGLGPADSAMVELHAKAQAGNRLPGAADFVENMMAFLKNTDDPDIPHGLVQVAEAILVGGPGHEIEAARQSLTRIANGNDRDITLFAILLRRFLAGQSGTSLAELTAGLETTEAVVDDIVESLRELLGNIEETVFTNQSVEEYAPLIKAVVAEVNGDTIMSAGLGALLAEMVNDPDWELLARALYKILDGQRGPDLAFGLGAADAAIITAVLNKICPTS